MEIPRAAGSVVLQKLISVCCLPDSIISVQLLLIEPKILSRGGLHLKGLGGSANAWELEPEGLVNVAYSTERGAMLHGRIEAALDDPLIAAASGNVNLILTSPPFPLVRKKRYGNENGAAYLEWLESLAAPLSELLAPDGSIVIEIGNAWEPGVPIMSTLPLEALFAFKKAAGLKLCQHVICHNPARLPSPAAWVNVERARLKDSFTHVWWMSKADFPKADNRRVLNPYSSDMKKLLRKQSYNSGRRPSGHVISETGFLTDHGGSISPNVVDITGEQFPGSLVKFTGTK